MNWERVLVQFLPIREMRRMDGFKKNVIEIVQDHILLQDPVHTDYTKRTTKASLGRYLHEDLTPYNINTHGL